MPESFHLHIRLRENLTRQTEVVHLFRSNEMLANRIGLPSLFLLALLALTPSLVTRLRVTKTNYSTVSLLLM
jgi:hypothetical protein